MKKILLFLSFLLMSVGVFGTKVSVSIADYATSNNWSNETKYTSVILDSYVTATVNGGGNTGKYYTNGNNWRLYQTENATITITTSRGLLDSVTFTYTTENSGTLNYGNINVASGTQINLSSNSAEFTVVNSGNKTNGQVRITNISVIYTDSSPTPTTYTVTYNANGGTGIMTDNNEYSSGAIVTILDNKFRYDGYTFTNWNTKDDGTGTKYDESDTFTISDNTILYAQWEENTPEPTTEPTIDVAVWDTGYVKITIDNFNASTALLEDKDTQHTQEKNVATKLFFSKYFEAAASIKLWAIYNGTDKKISLENVEVHVATYGNSSHNQHPWEKKLSLSGYGHIETGWIYPNEEIIVYNHGNETGTSAAKDTAIMNCVKEDYNIDEWYYHDGSTSFSGDDGLMLIDGTDTLDVIGGINYATAHSNTQTPSFGDGFGWYCENGKNINGDNTALSTNRCLLIRKNTVHSGDSAVKYNRNNFTTLCSEWVGAIVPKGDDTEDIINTCNNFSYVGTYNYGNYYAQFTEIVSDTALSQIIDSDSTYKFTYNFTDLSCTELKVIVKDTTDKNNIKSHEEIFRIPIFIYNDSTVKSFKEKNCSECDVVIMDGGKLTIGSGLENRNVTVYPGGRLIVPEGKTYTVNSLTLRRDNNDVPHLLNNGTISLENDSNYFFELRTDASDWIWTTLPSNHRVSDIKEHNGKPIKLGSEVFVRNYNGKTRAETQGNGWENTKPDSILSSGQGFIFGIDVKGSKKKIYKFKFPNAVVNSESHEKTITGLRAWGCNNENLAPNHKGWNLVGNPFTDNDTTDMIDPIKTGELVKDSTGTSWNGQWVYKAGSEARNLRYAVIPVTWRAWTADEAAAGGYASELLDDYILPPFISFFVQIGGDASAIQTLTFKPVGANPINRIVARAQQYDEDEELFLRVRIGDRKTGCFISNKFTDEYEPGDDLESHYPIYQSIGGYKLLYSAINDSIIEHGVQVTAPQGTLYLDPKVNINKFEYIYVHYNDEWYDLKNGQTVEVNGTFILQAKRQTQNVATGLDETNSNNKFSKYIYEGNIYIRKNNHIFTALGEFVK